MAWKLIQNTTKRNGVGCYSERNTETGEVREVLVSPEHLPARRNNDGAKCRRLVRSSTVLTGAAAGFETGTL